MMRSGSLFLVVWILFAGQDAAALPEGEDLSNSVNPLIGTANGGNTFPGAVLPFGMIQWSPETTRGDATRAAAPGGYLYDARKIRGFSLTHLSGTGCRGASGDIPFYPYTNTLASSPSGDIKNEEYASRFAHVNEEASPGYYGVRLESGVKVELTVTSRTGSGRFHFPARRPAAILIRTSDSEVGSSDASVRIDPASRKVTGSVTSGNFCGYLHEINRRSYYTLFFVAIFDRPFAGHGTWEDSKLNPDAVEARGGTTYGTEGYPAAGKGSGAYVTFDSTAGAIVNMRVGISYVSIENAERNLQAENPDGTTFKAIRSNGRKTWDDTLSRIETEGGTPDQRTIFYTALYHSLLHPNLFSDANGEYPGFDQKIHRVIGRQKNQYANFSGWDVYRSQLQLVALLDSKVGSDIAQSLLNQATHNQGEWDRWTHNSGATHVMEGDPSPASIAGIVAFGGTDFDIHQSYVSLLKAALEPTANDLSNAGCPVECVGQRPSLDQWLTLHYIAAISNSWGGAGETLEDAIADFSLAQLARRAGDASNERRLLERAQYWKNLFNSQNGYIQNRNADGSWPPFDPASDEGFAEGSSAQYTWMVPHNVKGLFDLLGGTEKACNRLDGFFHHEDGSWALTGVGSLKAEVDNEPSVQTPWLYLYCGKPYKTQQTIRQILTTLWKNSPDGIPGNDDLGAMSSWYVWSSIGFYPGIPGRAELLLSTPLFPRITINRPAKIVITASNASTHTYIDALTVAGQESSRLWLPEEFVLNGGSIDYNLSTKPNLLFATQAEDFPPSFDTQ